MSTPRGYTGEFSARLERVKQEKRGRVQWRMSHYTAELAIRAFQGHVRVTYVPGAKSRRRKKHKRLL